MRHKILFIPVLLVFPRFGALLAEDVEFITIG